MFRGLRRFFEGVSREFLKAYRVLYRSYRERLFLEGVYIFYGSVEGLQGVITVIGGLQKVRELSGKLIEGL